MWDSLKRFAGDRLDDVKKAAGVISDKVSNEIEYAGKQLRDKVVVPAIDAGMEAGVIPAAPGMYGRYLTGTEVPLTTAPAGIKEAESKIAARIAGPDQYQTRKDKYNTTKDTLTKLTALKDEDITADEKVIKDLLAEQDASGVRIRDHRMGVGSAQDPALVQAYIDREEQIKQLQSKWPNTNDLGGGSSLSTDASKYDASGTTARLQEDLKMLADYEKYKGISPSNYTRSGYGGAVMQSDATTNTLGQYEVQDGVLVDRYDFNQYDTPGQFNTGGLAGADQQSPLTQSLVELGGSLADRLGLIKPGSGYDVRLKLR